MPVFDRRKGHKNYKEESLEPGTRPPLRIVYESWNVKRKPDLMLVLMAAFGVGVLLTLMLPAANNSVAEPVSALQAGVIIDD